MEIINRTKSASIFFIVIIILFITATIISIIVSFSKISISLESKRLHNFEQEIVDIEEKLRSIEINKNKVAEYLLSNSDLLYFDKIFSIANLQSESDPRDKKLSARTLAYSFYYQIYLLNHKINIYNRRFENNEFVDPEFNKLHNLFYLVELGLKKEDKYDFETELDKLSERLAEMKDYPIISLKRVSTEFNSFIQGQIDKMLDTVNQLEIKKRSIRESIETEEERLEKSKYRINLAMLAKGITLTMLIVILVTLLSLLRYFINLFNKYQMLSIILLQYKDPNDIELLKLIISTDFKFDNKSEEILSNLFKK